jgi:hypothetical protein
VNPAAPFHVALPSAAPGPAQPPVAVLRRIFDPAPAHRPPGGPAPGGAPPSSPALPAVLRDIEGVRARIDGMLAQARHGRTFSPQELLCLQADSHRFAQSVEFAARAVEHGVQGLRQALNAQV